MATKAVLVVALSPLKQSSRRQETPGRTRSEEHTSELQSLMRTSYAVFCLKNTQQPTRNKDALHSHQTHTSRCAQHTLLSRAVWSGLCVCVCVLFASFIVIVFFFFNDTATTEIYTY